MSFDTFWRPTDNRRDYCHTFRMLCRRDSRSSERTGPRLSIVSWISMSASCSFSSLVAVSYQCRCFRQRHPSVSSTASEVQRAPFLFRAAQRHLLIRILSITCFVIRVKRQIFWLTVLSLTPELFSLGFEPPSHLLGILSRQFASHEPRLTEQAFDVKLS